jgi:hypothetical protein
MTGNVVNSTRSQHSWLWQWFAQRQLALTCFFCCGLVGSAVAADWNGQAQQLAGKIVAVSGPGAIALTTDNRSSLAKKDFDSISARLRAELESKGARVVAPEQAAAAVAVTLSENPRSYVWVAQIRQGERDAVVVMVSIPRESEAGADRDSMPVTLRKVPLWTQEDRILDILVMEDEIAPRHIAVLDAEKVALYRQKNGKWQQEQNWPIAHARPWPRDLRGRLLPAKDHLLDVYLPAVYCRSTAGLPLALNCRESDDPWPLAAGQSQAAFYSASRNFFTGALTPGVGKLTTIGRFYSAAVLPRPAYALWLFAGTDGQTHFVDGVTDQPAKLNWGSDVISVRAACGTGWQILATTGDNSGTDSVRAYEVADRDPAPVSAPMEFAGEITALWAEPNGDTAILITRSRETGDYDAFRLAMVCGQ